VVEPMEPSQLCQAGPGHHELVPKFALFVDPVGQAAAVGSGSGLAAP